MIGPKERRTIFIAVLAGFTLSLLLWAKLKLVGGVPRSVMADPEERQVEPDASRNESQTSPSP